MPPKICIYVDLGSRGLISGLRLRPRQVQNRLWAEVVGLTAEEAERKIKEEVDLGSRGLISGLRLRPRQVQNRLWAEVVGLTAEEAERKIKEEMAGVQIQVVPHDAFVTMDYQSKRVRIFVDSSGKVTKPSRIG